jgi:propanediol dehydratase small subunit
VTKDTPFDATHLEMVRPAIPEYDKSKPDADATIVMDIVKDTGIKMEDMQVNTTVIERLREADKDLGLDDFDAAFERAAKALDIHERPKSNVTQIKRDRLRKNKRGAANTGKQTHQTPTTDTVTSPESAA